MSVLIFALSAVAATISGQVREVGTGIIVSNATIQVNGETFYVDSSGRFVIDVSESDVVLQVRSPEHMMAEVTASQLLKRKDTVWLRLELAAPEMVVEDRREDPHAMSQVLDREQVERTPGTHDDPIRLLQSLSSVAKTREYGPSAGDVILRAAQPSENRVLLDGVEIPYLYHFQQYASVIHTRMLDTVTVYPSAYGARYGDAAGGIVNVQTKRVDRTNRTGAANLNLIVGGGTVSQPLGQGVLTLSGRRSHADLYDSGSEQYTEWPVFWDYLSRYEHSVSDQVHLSVSAIGARDTYGRRLFDTDQLNPVEQEANPNFVYDRMFHTMMFRADARALDWRSNTVLAAVNDSWKASLGEANQLRKDNYLWLRHQSDWILNDVFQLAGGVDGRLGKINRNVETDQAYPTLPDEAPLLNQGLTFSDDLSEQRVGLWVEPTVRFNDLAIQPGARYQFSPSAQQKALDPRLTMRFQKSFWGLRGGIGQYSQSPSADALSVNESLDITKAQHAALGADWVIIERLELSADVWGRQTDDAVFQAPGGALTTQDTTAFGGEVGLSYRMKERVFAWLSFSSANSRSDSQVWSYDQPYAIDGVFSWRFHPKWDFGFRYRYAAGLPYIPPTSSMYQANTNSYTAMYEPEFSGRLPDYQKIDLHIARRHWLGPMTMTSYMEVWYVPPNANYLYPIYNYNFQESQLVVGPPLVPLIGVRLEN